VIEDKPIKCFKVRHNDNYTYRIEIIYDDDSSTVVFDTPSDKAEHTYEVPENHRIIGVYGYDNTRYLGWILTTDFWSKSLYEEILKSHFTHPQKLFK